jgi:membrane protein
MTPAEVFGVFFHALREFTQRDGWVMGSHVALSLMLAVFPFMIFALSLAAQVSNELQTEDMMELVFGNWPEVVAAPIEQEVRAVLALGTNQTLTLGALLTVFFASNGVNAVRITISRSYNQPDQRPFWITRIICFVAVLIGAALLITTGVLLVVVPLYLSYFTELVPGVPLGFLDNDILRVSLAAAPMILAVFACHTLLDGARRSMKSVWPGVALTIILWTLFARGFSYYVGNFASYSVTYAGLAGVMSALIFLHLASAILLVGASFNAGLIAFKQKAAE